MMTQKRYLSGPVMFRGRDIKWIILMGQYAIEEQIDIRDCLQQAENLSFYAPLVGEIDTHLRNIELRALERYKMLTAEDGVWTPAEIEAMEGEHLRCNVEDFIHIDRLQGELSARLRQASSPWNHLQHLGAHRLVQRRKGP